ncbi:MAG: DUF4179 domain-containing protein [Chloroflexota bacterium]
MDKRVITQALQDQARKDIPEDMNMWPEMQERLGSVSRKAARSRVTWVIAALLALLAMSAIAYAAARLLQDQPLDPGLTGANESDLVTMLNMKKTIDGQTVTLDYAYADSNRISFALTSSGNAPLDVGYRFGEIELSDDAGHTFYTMFGGGGGGGSGGGSSVTPESMAYSSYITHSVDASVITDMPDKLNLHLTVNIEKYQLLPPLAMTESADMIAPDEMVRTLDPFVFDFTIPFIHGQVVDPDQTVTTNGITLHLGRMVLAPSLTRSVLCRPSTDVSGSTARVHLTVDGKPISLGGDEALQIIMTPLIDAATGCYDFQINQSLYNYPGHWTLSIDSLVTALLVSHSFGDDGTTAEHSYDGAVLLLAQVRAKLEPQLKPYGIELREENGSLKFSYPSSTDQTEKAALQQIGDFAVLVETPGPWVFTFDVPPAQ